VQGHSNVGMVGLLLGGGGSTLQSAMAGSRLEVVGTEPEEAISHCEPHPQHNIHQHCNVTFGGLLAAASSCPLHRNPALSLSRGGCWYTTHTAAMLSWWRQP
jgi:hypothetical protein